MAIFNSHVSHYQRVDSLLMVNVRGRSTDFPRLKQGRGSERQAGQSLSKMKSTASALFAMGHCGEPRKNMVLC